MSIYTAGLICQHVLKEENGIYSALRIADMIEIELPANVDLSKFSFQQISCHALFIFKSDQPEEFEVEISYLKPDGNREGRQVFPIKLKEAPSGHLLDITMEVQPQAEGVYWVEAYIKSTLATRIPFRIVHKNPQKSARKT